MLSSELIPLAPHWGVHCGSGLHGVRSVFCYLPEGSAEGLQSQAQLPCSWVHQEGFVMTSCVSSLPPSCLWEGSVCSGTGACSIWSARNWPSHSPRAFLPLLCVSSSPWRLGCTPGVAQEGWAGMRFGTAPQLCLGGLKNPICRGWPAAIMSGSAPSSPRLLLRCRYAFVCLGQESWCLYI